MLALRPTCEHCNKALPPASTEAMICSFECTFCRDCVELLQSVCPNCGGGFVPRPIRPAHAWRPGTSLDSHPGTLEVTHKPVNMTEHAILVTMIGDRPPEQR